MLLLGTEGEDLTILGFTSRDDDDLPSDSSEGDVFRATISLIVEGIDASFSELKERDSSPLESCDEGARDCCLVNCFLWS